MLLFTKVKGIQPNIDLTCKIIGSLLSLVMEIVNWFKENWNKQNEFISTKMCGF